MQQRERNAVPEKERKRAAEDLSKRIKNFKILSSITQAVHQSLDLEKIYKITLDMTADLENVDMVTIYLVDEDRKEAVLQAQRNLPGDYIRRASRIPYPKGATWEVVKSGKVLNIEDIQKDPDVGPAGKALGHHGLLGIPIALEEAIDRRDAGAYKVAIYLLRRVVNLDLRTVAKEFDISTTRVSKILREIERMDKIDLKLQQLLRQYKVKQ